MPFQDNMQEAQPNTTALSTEYNKVVSNVRWVHERNKDQDSWITHHLGGIPANDATHDTINARLDSLESNVGNGGGLFVVRMTEPVTTVVTTSGGGGEISWDAVDKNTLSVGVSGSRMTVGITGWYTVTAQAALESGSDETVGLYLLKGSSTTSGASDGVVLSERPSKSGVTAFQIAGVAFFEAGDVLKVRVYRDGGLLNIRGTENQSPYGGTFFSMKLDG